MARRNELLPEVWRNERVWNPMREIGRLQRRIDRMFDDIFPSFTGFHRPESSLMDLEERVFTPPIDVEDVGDHFIVSMDIPGVSKNDVKIEMQDSQLLISGERKRERQVGEGSNLGLERFYGTFQRWFTLPQNVDPDKIEAHYDKGVLRIAIPKLESAQAKTIPIKEEGGGIFKKLLGKEGKEGKSEKAA